MNNSFGFLLSSARTINRVTTHVGRLVRWLSLFMVLTTCAVVLLRYVFSYYPIALQEAVMYFHGSLFMLGASYAWQHNAHVRVDVFYRNWSTQRQALVNRLGTLFLLMPTCLFLLWVSWDYVSVAWQIQERSQEAGGLPIVYIQKSLIIAMPILMLLQSIAMLIDPVSEAEQHTNEEHANG